MQRLVFVFCWCALLISPLQAAPPILQQDGWYRWEVSAGRGGINACCHEIRGGAVNRVACTLGDGKNVFSPDDDCGMRSDTMQIFVELRDGVAREIQALSSACPVRSDSKIRTIADVSTEESIAWLRAQARENRRVTDEAIMSLSFHPEAQALPVLVALLEDTNERHAVREQVLFWLVQSDSEEVYAYIDKLLD